MIYNDIIFGTVPVEDVAIDKRELRARLGADVDIDNAVLNGALSKCEIAITYRYAYARVPLTATDNVCDFGFSKVESESLAKVLGGSSEAYILAVSAGIDIDRVISRSAIQNKAEAFIIDAIASASIESFADYINDMICKGLEVTNRFSPGYADFPLSFQLYLLERLNSAKTVGITLSDKLLMTPMKSITAVIGIK